MSDGRRIFRNFSALMAAQIVSNLAGLLTTAWLARALMPEAFGVIGWGIAVIGYLGLLVNFGIDRHALRLISRDRDAIRDISGTVLSLRLVLAAILYALWLGFIAVLDRDPLVRMVFAVQGLGLFVTAITLDFAFQAVERMGVNAARQIAASLLGLAGALLLVKGAGDVALAAGVTVVATGLAALGAMAVFSTRFGTLAIGWNPPRWRNMLRASAPVALAGILTTIYITADLVMLGFMADAQEVGLYSASARLSVMALVPASMVGAAFLPQLAASRDDQPRRARIAARHAAPVLVVGAVIAALAVAYPGQLLGIVFGDAYLPATVTLGLLLAASAVSCLRLCHDAALLAWDFDRERLVTLGAAAALNIALNLVLIPRFGGYGAALATLAAEVVAFLSMAVLARLRAGLDLAVPVFGAMVLAAILAAICVLGAPDPLANPARAAVALLACGLVSVAGWRLLDGLARRRS
jgi:O-antigen/teichoic acid export membrane protein